MQRDRANCGFSKAFEILRAERGGRVPRSIGDLAGYLMVSCQNFAGLIGRMERDGHIAVVPDERGRQSRFVGMTPSNRHIWQALAQPKVRACYEEVLGDLSINDTANVFHDLNKIPEGMKRLDEARSDGTIASTSGQ